MSPFDDPEVCRSILEALPTGVCVVDMQRRIVFWSDGAERITGHLRHEVIGHSCVAEPLLHCDQPGCEFCSDHCPIARAIRTSHGSVTTGLLHHKEGHEIPVRVRAIPVHNQHGSVIGAVETFEDLQPATSANRGGSCLLLPDCLDPATGVASKAVMQSHLRHSLANFNEARLPFGVLLVHLEGLPNFRASLGLEAAASLLRLVARTLENAFITDFIGRWNDDQFLAIVSGCREESIHTVRERLRRTLAGEAIEWWGERHSLPVTIGGAIAQPGDTMESLLERVQKSLAASSSWRMRRSGTATTAPGS